MLELLVQRIVTIRGWADNEPWHRILFHSHFVLVARW